MKKIVLVVLSLTLILSLTACGKSTAPVITAAKDHDGLNGGAVLSAEDAAALAKELEAAEKENTWIDAISDSIASCYFSVKENGEETVYKYCADGILDDVTHFRSLILGDAACEAVSAILSEYVELGGIPIPIMPVIPDREIELIPRG